MAVGAFSRDYVATGFAAGVNQAAVATDGCGAPVLAISLTGLARAFSRIASAPTGTAKGAVAAAIRSEPRFLGSTGRDVTALIEPLQAAGFRATLIDETYGRTLRVENPDDASVEAEIWINETQTDLYGYREGLSE